MITSKAELITALAAKRSKAKSPTTQKRCSIAIQYLKSAVPLSQVMSSGMPRDVAKRIDIKAYTASENALINTG